MADLDSAFREYYPPTAEQRHRAITKGLVCLDTNVLLDAYRFAPTARDELLSVLGKLGERLWVPHQVAREFHRNRIKVIGDQAAGYTAALGALSELEEYFKKHVESKIKSLGRLAALSELQVKAIIEPLALAITKEKEAIDNLMRQHGINLDMVEEDPVLKRLEELLKGRVGEPPTIEDEEQDIKEAKRRSAEKLPPGYADQHKSDGSGDYMVWVQVLREAKRRGKPILFVTRDVKEDWFRREKGKTLSARPELIREARETAQSDLVIMETKQFLFHARKHLNVAVSDELISQLDKMPRLSKSNFEQYEKPNGSDDSTIERLAVLGERIREIDELISINASESVRHIDDVDGSARMREIQSHLSELRAYRVYLEHQKRELLELRRAEMEDSEDRDPLIARYGRAVYPEKSRTLSALVLPELQQLAADMGIPGVQRMRKSQLIAAILEKVHVSRQATLDENQ